MVKTQDHPKKARKKLILNKTSQNIDQINPYSMKGNRAVEL